MTNTIRNTLTKLALAGALATPAAAYAQAGSPFPVRIPTDMAKTPAATVGPRTPSKDVCDPRYGSTIIASVTNTAPTAAKPFRPSHTTLSNYDADPAVEGAIYAQPANKFIILSGDDSKPYIIANTAFAPLQYTDATGRGIIDLDKMRAAKKNHVTFEGNAFFRDANGKNTCTQPYQLHVEFAGASQAKRTAENIETARIAQLQAADSTERAQRIAGDNRLDGRIDSLANVVRSQQTQQSGIDSEQNARINAGERRPAYNAPANEQLTRSPRRDSGIVEVAKSGTPAYVLGGVALGTQTTDFAAGPGSVAGKEHSTYKGLVGAVGVKASDRVLFQAQVHAGNVEGELTTNNPRLGGEYSQPINGQDYGVRANVAYQLTKNLGVDGSIDMQSVKTKGEAVNGSGAFTAAQNRTQLQAGITVGPQHLKVGVGGRLNMATRATPQSDNTKAIVVSGMYDGATTGRGALDARVEYFSAKGSGDVAYSRSGIAATVIAPVIRVGKLGVAGYGTVFTEDESFGTKTKRSGGRFGFEMGYVNR